TSHAYGNLVILVSKRFWDKLSKTEQRILRESFAEARDYEREESRRQAAAAAADLRAKGLEINEVAPEEMERMRQATLPVTKKFSAAYDPEVMRLFGAELERIRAIK